ncbi:uncharacterized protein METZ01_LOCUS384242, partial [marine metagenome]
VNYPLACFAERIGGELIAVHFPEINGDPAFWEPKAKDVRAFQGADILLLNGATYAKWTTETSLPESKIVNTSASFRDRFIEVNENVAHQHGKDIDHSHAGTAFTTWLDLKQAEQQATAIRDTLIKLLPNSERAIKNNFDALQRDLQALDTELMEISGKIGKTPLAGSHPIYQYLARGYDLQIRSVSWEPDKMPDANGWAELAAIRKEYPSKIMLWEAKPDKAIARKLVEQGVSSVVFNPCGNRPDEGDWLSVIQANISRLSRAVPKK